jgi:radical SAM protein with 4Fe4S-binding SPASM domain
MINILFSSLFRLKKVRWFDRTIRHPAVKITLYRLFRRMGTNSLFSRLLLQHARRKIEEWEQDGIPKLLIEPTNLCNASCSSCPQQFLIRKRGVMGMRLFERILDQVADLGIETVTLTGYGEPMQDPHFMDKLALVDRKGLKVFFFTNGTFLTPENSRKLLEFKNLIQINLSVAGSNFEEYCRDRAYSSPDVNARVLVAFENLVGLKKEIQSTVRINVQPVYPPESIRESMKIKKYWTRLGADQVDGNIRHSFATREMGRQPGHYSHIPCKLLWDALLILWDGRVAMCCEDVNGRQIIGDLKTEKLKDILFGEKITRLRRIHLEGNRDRIETCRYCDIFSFWY